VILDGLELRLQILIKNGVRTGINADLIDLFHIYIYQGVKYLPVSNNDISFHVKKMEANSEAMHFSAALFPCYQVLVNKDLISFPSLVSYFDAPLQNQDF